MITQASHIQIAQNDTFNEFGGLKTTDQTVQAFCKAIARHKDQYYGRDDESRKRATTQNEENDHFFRPGGPRYQRMSTKGTSK